MNKDDFWVGAIAGAIVGMLFIAGLSIYLRDRGREECDNKLPRTEKCVQVWVPEARSKP